MDLGVVRCGRKCNFVVIRCIISGFYITGVYHFYFEGMIIDGHQTQPSVRDKNQFCKGVSM
jgi:hypothetical protein